MKTILFLLALFLLSAGTAAAGPRSSGAKAEAVHSFPGGETGNGRLS